MTFEVTHHDLAARLGKLETNHGTLETPTLLPVISPRDRVIPPARMKEFGAGAVITNAYFIKKEFGEEALDRGVHGFLEFDGPVMTDSGAFQAMSGMEIGLTNREIIEFQKRIGVDMGIILDQATASRNREDVEKAVAATIASAREAAKLVDGARLWVCPVQGSVFPDLVRKSARAVPKEFDVCALGSVVPLMERYNFDLVVRAIAA
ncbi:tRNA-guanine transglycosylase, partial [Candidatus Micrarchaeota archaeon]|nr:tRNA-guanine transglycosylase [Candidatus Micrarchaeota archaeon]